MRRLLAVAALVLVAACGSGGSSDPETPATSARSATPTTGGPRTPPTGPAAAVDAMMRALDAGDCRGMRKVVVTPSAVDCEVVRSAKDSFADEGIDLDDVVYEAGPVNGSSSTVTITWGNGTPDESYDVEKSGGRWRVVFDSAA
ncbi:hypothetical protein [Aeromicrobium chenweiae]|uniref:Uncharacterized protein n=1 Tax=Aeromicrobium chenweiae TaxID=2079793 RepID=A0A2S0WPX4_9ACTN|nr:hypothetical protein [Aeromicrobium chenweiae]AWB93377.1 hypothetical protein C3E78_14790 [Aeromicrobium chenweiae]TGN34368.1 hypothetical protein E4L97_04815 [Aeromicrobium chenweiae]